MYPVPEQRSHIHQWTWEREPIAQFENVLLNISQRSKNPTAEGKPSNQLRLMAPWDGRHSSIFHLSFLMNQFEDQYFINQQCRWDRKEMKGLINAIACVEWQIERNFRNHKYLRKFICLIHEWNSSSLKHRLSFKSSKHAIFKSNTIVSYILLFNKDLPASILEKRKDINIIKSTWNKVLKL